MALQKAFTLPNGAGGNYIQVGVYTWDRITKRASAELLLFTTAERAASNPEAPLTVIARLVLTDTLFDRYFSAAALAAVAPGTVDPIRAQLYEAAKAGEPFRAGGGLRQDEISFADAVDV